MPVCPHVGPHHLQPVGLGQPKSASWSKCLNRKKPNPFRFSTSIAVKAHEGPPTRWPQWLEPCTTPGHWRSLSPNSHVSTSNLRLIKLSWNKSLKPSMAPRNWWMHATCTHTHKKKNKDSKSHQPNSQALHQPVWSAEDCVDHLYSLGMRIHLRHGILLEGIVGLWIRASWPKLSKQVHVLLHHIKVTCAAKQT